jgi:hypothetical protein
MVLDIYNTVILGSIFITTIMLLLFSYILKGYRKLARSLYQKAVRKYPNKMQDNRFALKLLSLAIQIYLYAMYSVLIYFIITLVLPYKR